MTSYLPALTEFAARRSRRIEYTIAAQRRLASDRLPPIEHYISASNTIARDDPRAFRTAFGEELPLHAAYALETEIGWWTTLEERIAAFRAADPTPGDIAIYNQHLKDFLSCALTLLYAEEQLISTCLTQYYFTLTDDLRAKAQTIPL